MEHTSWMPKQITVWLCHTATISLNQHQVLNSSVEQNIYWCRTRLLKRKTHITCPCILTHVIHNYWNGMVGLFLFSSFLFFATSDYLSLLSGLSCISTRAGACRAPVLPCPVRQIPNPVTLPSWRFSAPIRFVQAAGGDPGLLGDWSLARIWMAAGRA